MCAEVWIASELKLLAMTTQEYFITPSSTLPKRSATMSRA
jgi:hypothetical protein